ncbi:TolC family protein [Algiphilus sp.]|uniref:TolC family protein n=1 Tax=Algiphilus sp. TaxID=1872431 RepID=UPI003B51E90E
MKHSQFHAAERRIARLFSLLLMAVSLSLSAAEPTQRLTSAALVAEVLRANASIAALEASQQALAAEARRADALDDPRLHYAIAPKSIDDPSVETGHIVGISQSLPWPGKRTLQRQRALSEAEAAGYGLEVRRRELAFEARNAFADWAFLGGALRINAEQQAQLRTLVTVAEQRYAAGSGTQQDPLAAKVRLLRLREAQWQLEAEQETARARLNALRQRASDTPLPEAAAIPLQTDLPPMDRLVQAAEQTHPGLAQLDAERDSAEASRDLERLARRPDFTLSANYVGTLPREPYRTQLGVALTVPFGQDKYDAAQAAALARSERVRATRDDLAHRLRADVRSAYGRWRAADRARRLYEQELSTLAQQSRETALALYSRGRGDVQAVIDAETEWLAVRTGRLRTQRDAFQALARLAQLSGGRFDDSLLAETQP